MKHVISVFILVFVFFGLVINQILPADAAKKTSKKKGMSPDAILELQDTVDNLTKKIYERELYSPEDSNALISLKLKLDEQMDILPETSFAPIYFKIGNIYRMRGEEKDAINCYQTIIENFSETAYGPKSRDILNEMGVEIKLPNQNDDEEGFSEDI